ncbi:MAG: M23 family metallopeptidase [Bdellovibrionota bacterium]
MTLKLCAAVLLSVSVFGCATTRMVDTGQRGILQGDAPQELPQVNTTLSLSDAALEDSDAGFVWPLRLGKISSLFGKRKRDFHEGIDIKAPKGTPIFAAKEGTVIYSARRINGYGNMIVIKHDDGMATVYAHNRKNLVKRGQRVTQNQLVGFVGATGKATGPHLHFEIRKGETAQDPLLYLPELKSPAVAQK